jgi:hypothetical protein
LEKEMSGQIFISYRRDDAPHAAARIFAYLEKHFPDCRLFMDIDNLGAGENFVQTIKESVNSCDVLIAVIGSKWVNAIDKQGNRRIDNPQDWVRLEVAAALKRGIRVIPVLVDEALLLRETELPSDLQLLAQLHAVPVSYGRFSADLEPVASAIKRVFEKAGAERLDAERRERDEKERLEAEARQKEEKERLKAEQRERENQRLLNERREKDRLAAERLEADRQRRLEGLAKAREAREHLQGEQRQREKKEPPQVKTPPTATQTWIGKIDKFSSLPFVASTVLFVWVAVISNLRQSFDSVLEFSLIFVGLPCLVTISSFFSYPKRRILEAIASVASVAVALFMIFVGSKPDPRRAPLDIGADLWVYIILLALGMLIKFWLLYESWRTRQR